MKKIVNVAFSSAFTSNFNQILDLKGKKINLIHLGADYDLALTEEIIKKFDGDADIICLSGTPEDTVIDNKLYIHPDIVRIKNIPQISHLVQSNLFRDIYIPWAIERYANEYSDLFAGKSAGFYIGFYQKEYLKRFKNIFSKIFLCDPYFSMNLPFPIPVDNLELFYKYIFKLVFPYNIDRPKVRDFRNKTLKKFPLLKNFLNCDIFFGDSGIMDLIRLNDLSNKTFIIDYLTHKDEIKLQSAGVENIISCFPNIFNLPFFSSPIMEGIFQAYKNDDQPLTADDIFEFIEEFNIKPEVKCLKKTKHTDKFSFIVHPLSLKDLFRHPLSKPLGKINLLPKQLFEKACNMMPAIKYGEVTGIKSDATGKVIRGDIYTIFSTPKMLMESRPETVYRKLVAICEKAKKNGAKIIGLGAYTKIVGDAGVTVARRSPIPLTTGNSLSAAATIWAADLVVKKINLVEQADKTFLGTGMVIGATGSIGRVCSMYLAENWKKLIIAAPRAHKLLELKEEILKNFPEINIIITTKPDKYADQCDLIITSTSAKGDKILDIEKVKPGCVICDVSRPFDISAEDAIKRPDVLVVASGEVELPGEVKINCDIGLEGSVVYACLAETAILTMEGRFESFTLSQNISYAKVKEIDILARKHGVKLSGIMGHDIEITDEEIALCRDHALAKLKIIP